MGSETKTTKVVLDLDNREFVKKLKESLGLLGEIGETESVSNLGSMFLKVGAVAGVAAGAVLAVKAALDLATEAEHINQINLSFDALTKSAGLSADVIKNDLVKAVKGLADDTDVLQAANKAIVAMGGNASHLGETMELARKATVLFGGDLLQNFEAMNQALASGNTRALRQFGLIIDQDKAYKAYAKSLGVGVQYLDDAGKKQAILNAALEQGKTKFKDVDESTLATTNNLKKMSVSFNELKESAILAWDKVAGPTVKATTGWFAEVIHNVAVGTKALFGTEKDAAEYRKQKMEEQEASLNRILEAGKKGVNTQAAYGLTVEEARAELEHIHQLKTKEQEMDERSMQLAMHKAQAESMAEGKKGADAGEPKHIDYEKLKQDRQKFEKELDQLRAQRAEADLQSAETEDQATTAFNEKVIAQSLENQTKRQEIKRQFYETGVISEEQYHQAIDEINRREADQLKNYDQEVSDARIRALENSQAHAKTAAAGMRKAFATEAAKASKDMKNFGKMGGMVFGSLKKNAVSAFKALGDGSQDAGQAMKSFLFGAIADVAEAHGEVMIAEGIGTYNPVEIAEGGVLIALGSAIRAAAGGKGGGGGISGGGGGGGGSASLAANPEETKPEPVQQQKKAVTVSIAGNYFETEQTRTRLMDMIRESGDFTDFNLKQIGQT